MSSEAFFNLLKRYLDGKCTDEEREIVEQWYALLGEGDVPDLQTAELDQIKERLSIQIDRKIHNQESQNKSAWTRSLWPKLSAAAAFIGLMILAYLFVSVQKNAPDAMSAYQVSDLVTEKNTTDSSLKINLQDGSYVTLQPGSILTYPSGFKANLREVRIEGEGFFEVSKDKNRPFLVYSNNLVTRVLGTSFIVKALNGSSESEVTVLTGKVTVASTYVEKVPYKNLFNSPNKEVVLTPNYKVIYREDENSLDVTLADNPILIQKQTGAERAMAFVFNNVPVEHVFAQLEEAYGININLNKKILKCTFTGDLSDQTMRAQIDFISHAIGAKYTIENAEIHLEGGFCP